MNKLTARNLARPSLCILDENDQKVCARRANFFRQSIITAASFDESLSHHEGREGHEDRITERASNLEKMFSSFVLFVCFVVKILTFGCGFAALGST
jgi:hypothetical protein